MISQVSAQKTSQLQSRVEQSGVRLALHSSGRGLLSIFALVLAQSLGASLRSPVQDGLAVLVHLQLDDDQLAGVDTDIDGGSVGLLSLDPLNVDPELLPVALDYLAHLLSLVVTSDNLQRGRELEDFLMESYCGLSVLPGPRHPSSRASTSLRTLSSAPWTAGQTSVFACKHMEMLNRIQLSLPKIILPS